MQNYIFPCVPRHFHAHACVVLVTPGATAHYERRLYVSFSIASLYNVFLFFLSITCACSIVEGNSMLILWLTLRTIEVTVNKIAFRFFKACGAKNEKLVSLSMPLATSKYATSTGLSSLRFLSCIHAFVR